MPGELLTFQRPLVGGLLTVPVGVVFQDQTALNVVVAQPTAIPTVRPTSTRRPTATTIPAPTIRALAQPTVPVILALSSPTVAANVARLRDAAAGRA